MGRLSCLMYSEVHSHFMYAFISIAAIVSHDAGFARGV